MAWPMPRLPPVTITTPGACVGGVGGLLFMGLSCLLCRTG
ncbi:hypothetical protein SXCC_01497 [Gluconacetobacter sp. SXCC-1]|nr:hypothetical protein SXCC_01497 [Gluconacetobacter sp. SXCC-1]